MHVITLSLNEYLELVEADQKLSALEAYGVDNWEWYDEAMKSLEEDLDEEVQMQAVGYHDRP